jgi:hypothetical protein
MTKKRMFSVQTNDSGQVRHDGLLIGDIEALRSEGICGDTSQSSAPNAAARRRRRNATVARQWSRWLEPLFRIY